MMRVVILGAGFAGLELSTILAQHEEGRAFDVTLIDRSDAFVFGYSKLDVMFGRARLDEVRVPYSALSHPGVRFVRETVRGIDPDARRVTTDAGVHDADVLVVALGADYDYDATPGLREQDSEFYSVAGAARLAGVIPQFDRGRVLIGVCGAPFKCPPAPSEAAFLLHDQLVQRGVRDACEIVLVTPFQTPIPPSPDTSAAILEAFAQRGIEFSGRHAVASVDPRAGVAVLDDGEELDYDLFLGVPRHRAPDVVIESGMAEDGYILVDSATLQTRHAGVYACGDVATVGVPKAGVFAEGAARVIAAQLIAQVRDAAGPAAYDGKGSCYIEFGGGLVARVDIDFLSGPKRTGVFNPASDAIVAEKRLFGSSRRARWFGTAA